MIDAIAHWFDVNSLTILNGVARGVLILMLAAGLTIVFGLLDVLNVAHGAIFLLGAYIGVELSSGSVLSWVLAVLVAAGAGALLGCGLDILCRPLAHRGHVAQLLLTLGVAFILQDAIAWNWGHDPLSVAAPEPVARSVEVFGRMYPLYRLLVIGFGVALAVGLYLAFERTQLGAKVRAVVSDRHMAAAVGINVQAVSLGVFAAGTALAAIAGVVGGPILGARPGLDSEVLILALVVMVIGGVGSLRGAMVGALLVGQLETLGISLAPNLAGFLLFGAMVAVLIARPEGLLAR